MSRIDVLRIADISEDLEKKLSRMSFKDGSLMRQTFKDLRKDLAKRMGRDDYPHDGLAWILYDGDYIIGWALTFKEDQRRTVYFWIKQKHRRLGYGKMLCDQIKAKYKKKLCVIAHDTPSTQFFKKMRL